MREREGGAYHYMFPLLATTNSQYICTVSFLFYLFQTCLHLFQLAEIRGSSKKDTLLKFLILQLQQNYPEALTFYNELKSVSKAVDGTNY